MEQPGLPQNGRHEAEDDRSDRRALLMLMGGILLAFTVGVVILAIALLIDWKTN